MLIQWRASSQWSVAMSSPSRGREAAVVGSVPMRMTLRDLLLIFLCPRVYQKIMSPQEAAHDRPDIVAATRGGDVTLGMEGEADPASAHLIGKPLSSQSIAMAALLASEQAECLSDGYASADYRKHLVKTEVTRALASLSDA